MKSFSFRLPVKTYIQKYLTTLYGEIIPAIMDSDIGFVVLNTLASRLEAQVCRGYNNQAIGATAQSTITFTVPFHYFYLTKRELSVHTCILLNRYFENKFETDLNNHIRMQMAIGVGYKQAIEDFARQHNIDLIDDISYDALKKKEYRSRKKNFNNSLCRLSPAPNLFTQAVA